MPLNGNSFIRAYNKIKRNTNNMHTHTGSHKAKKDCDCVMLNGSNDYVRWWCMVSPAQFVIEVVCGLPPWVIDRMSGVYIQVLNSVYASSRT